MLIFGYVEAWIRYGDEGANIIALAKAPPRGTPILSKDISLVEALYVSLLNIYKCMVYDHPRLENMHQHNLSMNTHMNTEAPFRYIK
jgi:hypothetical protein